MPGGVVSQPEMGGWGYWGLAEPSQQIVKGVVGHPEMRWGRGTLLNITLVSFHVLLF
jgi:hypothetical protein